MIQSALGVRPDALYVLVQNLMIQDMMLKNTQAELDALKSAQAPAKSSSFLSPWGQKPADNTQQQQQQAPRPVPNQAQPQQNAAPSFLQSAMTTAGGVLAGSLAFSAISSMFGGGHGGIAGAQAANPTIVNNYYDSEDEDDSDSNENDSQTAQADEQDDGDYGDFDGGDMEA